MFYHKKVRSRWAYNAISLFLFVNAVEFADSRDILMVGVCYEMGKSISIVKHASMFCAAEGLWQM
eukprot:c37620_g1_i1 orf=271-465(+)